MLGDAIANVSNAFNSVSNRARDFVGQATTYGRNLINQVSGFVSSQFDGDVVGLNVAGIGPMKQAIESYIKTVEDHVNQLKESNLNTDAAMKGEFADAVKTYIATAADCCYCIVTQLRYFEDKLTDVENAYKEKSTSLASTINDSSSELKNEYTEYKAQQGN